MKILTSLLFILILPSVFAQNPILKALEINHEIIDADEYIGKDALGYDYFIKNNTFLKIKDKEIWQYKSISLGKISRVDIQNPLQIILFYGNFNVIISLDSQLNEVQKINLSEVNQEIAATAVGLSSNKNLWLFNSLNQQLAFYNYSTNTYKNLGQPFNKTIKEYRSSFNHFYWTDESNALYYMDIFGKTKLIGIIPAYDILFIVNEGTVLYKKDETVYFLDLEKNTTFIIEIAQKSFKNFYYKDQILSIFTTEGITNYKIDLP